MTKPKKRPSKASKAAKRIVSDSKLLANAQAVKQPKPDGEFKPENPSPKTSAANKLRPEKKRG